MEHLLAWRTSRARYRESTCDGRGMRISTIQERFSVFGDFDFCSGHLTPINRTSDQNLTVHDSARTSIS